MNTILGKWWHIISFLAILGLLVYLLFFPNISTVYILFLSALYLVISLVVILSKDYQFYKQHNELPYNITRLILLKLLLTLITICITVGLYELISPHVLPHILMFVMNNNPGWVPLAGNIARFIIVLWFGLFVGFTMHRISKRMIKGLT